ncbi:hypothetical protein RND71_013204 [Anisodus tanguticus]|uniref:Uncharacterized protein n=1 Tax=Anisodus tanguticus TaxID=243964 RepID=A0AAE1VHN5_9SOLA|nr:hypothetical protein RND71_013204 [Anisodus tanguticus]
MKWGCAKTEIQNNITSGFLLNQEPESSGRKRKAPSPEENESSRKTVFGGETVVTLPLLSEIPERKGFPRDHDVVIKPAKNGPIWLSFDGNQGNNNHD